MSIDWGSFLTEWIELERLRRCPEDVIYEQNNPYLGFPEASEAQIIETERRLGVALPQSYKRFISFTNGWYKNSIGYAYQRLLPIEEIDWFRVKEPEWLENWIEGAGGMPDENPSVPDEIYFAGAEPDLRIEYLQSALQISECGDSDLILLIPEVIFEDREWEAWYFANWLGGARRYTSFEELMIGSYDIQKQIWEKLRKDNK